MGSLREALASPFVKTRTAEAHPSSNPPKRPPGASGSAPIPPGDRPLSAYHPAMSAASEILARRMRLPRARTRDVVCIRDLAVPMDDGAVLLADRWVARDSDGHQQPTVLVRSPYGRRDLVGLIFGRLPAERGLQVVIQSVRGTFGSEGAFSPFDERADGLATLRWLREQPWHRGRIGMLGPSYLGLVQWAVASEAGDDLAALSIDVSASQFHGQTFAGGALSLETAASWMALVAAQERRFAPVAMPVRSANCPARSRSFRSASSTYARRARRSNGSARR